jgi:hypothetical protein
MTDLFNRPEPLQDKHIERMASTLERMRIVAHDEVESVLDAIRDRSQRERLREHMAAQRASKAATLNIGVLASVGGQDFYLKSMAEPHLRHLVADLMELLITAKSLGAFVSRGIARLRVALGD